jgi:hypothetical protein
MLPLASSPPSGPERMFPGTDPEVLREATARMNALGIDGNAVIVTRDRTELMAFLGVGDDACATSS